MKPIATQNIVFNGTYYEKGDEVKVESKEALIKLIEKGYIEPLTMKEIQNFGNKPETKKLYKEEE